MNSRRRRLAAIRNLKRGKKNPAGLWRVLCASPLADSAFNPTPPGRGRFDSRRFRTRCPNNKMPASLPGAANPGTRAKRRRERTQLRLQPDARELRGPTIGKHQPFSDGVRPRISRRASPTAEVQRKATAIVNVVRVIAPSSYHFVIAVWRAKQAESGG